MTQAPRDAKERSADEKLRMITPLLLPGMDKEAQVRAKRRSLTGKEYHTGRWDDTWRHGRHTVTRDSNPNHRGTKAR